MCNRAGNGQVEKREFYDLVKSLNTIVGVSIEEAEQEEIIESVLQKCGISEQSSFLTHDDFEAIFKAVEDLRRPIGVHMRGVKLKINLDEFVNFQFVNLSQTLFS